MIIVLIGSPMSGKTTILKKLQNNGVKVFSADSYVNSIYRKGQPGYIKIKDELGNEFVNDNSVNKIKLASWAYKNENLLRLNELIHPLIFEYLKDKDNFVSELPIITNSHVKFKYDKIILVKASKEEIEKRFNKSNINNKEFINKIINDWEKNNYLFDYVIDTTNGIKESDINNIIKLINEK